MEAPAGGVDDMTKLSYLHEPGVLQNLKTRYELNEIYVSTSSPSLIEICFSFQESKFLCRIHMILDFVVADLYREYPYCNKSIPKASSSL